MIIQLYQKSLTTVNLLIEFSQMHLSDNSGGDTDTLGPLPTMGNGPGWSSSDDQISLPPYDGPHQQQYQNYYSSPYSQSPGIVIVKKGFVKLIILFPQ